MAGEPNKLDEIADPGRPGHAGQPPAQRRERALFGKKSVAANKSVIDVLLAEGPAPVIAALKEKVSSPS